MKWLAGETRKNTFCAQRDSPARKRFDFLTCVCAGIRTEQDLYVRLIDSMTKQVRRASLD